MRLSFRKWGVPTISWLAVFAFAGMALAGAGEESVEPTASLLPDEVAEGKTLESAEPLEMTLALSANPETDYDLAITYGADPVGVCQTDAATITTDVEGEGSFVCSFTTVVNEGTDDLVGTITFSVSLADELVTENVANLTVAAAEPEEPEEPEVTQVEGEAVINHGHCVSYWARRAKADGLTGRAKGAFVSAIAEDEEAVSSKVSDDGEPDETCDFSEALAEALAEQEADDAESPIAQSEGTSKAKGPKGPPQQETGEEDQA
ncbi:MAG TPA: hypothetical protein VGB52_15730 [Actinomycetota bacterium]